MILSTGLDICDIRRIEKILSGKTAARFMQRYFTPAENEHIARRKPHAHAAAYARRWAAKEAIAKALGTGFRGGLHMHQMEVLNDINGKPSVKLQSRALELLTNLLPSPSGFCRTNGSAQPASPFPSIHVAMSDEYPYAMAQIIISV